MAPQAQVVLRMPMSLPMGDGKIAMALVMRGHVIAPVGGRWNPIVCVSLNGGARPLPTVHVVPSAVERYTQLRQTQKIIIGALITGIGFLKMKGHKIPRALTPFPTLL